MTTPSAPQPPRSPVTSKLLSLPPEIHMQIYSYYFNPAHPSEASLRRLHHRNPTEAAYAATNILLTNHQVHIGALAIFCITHRFTFSQLACFRQPPTPTIYIAPKNNNDILGVVPFLRYLRLYVTPALFQTQALQEFQCTLQLNQIVAEILRSCPVLRTLDIELNSKSGFDPESDLGYWFLAGRPLEPGTESFWIFQKARIRIEVGSASFPSHEGQVVIADDRKPSSEVLLCDLDNYTGTDWNEDEVWEAAAMAAMGGERVKRKRNAASDPRGRMVGWTQVGREIWRKALWKGALRATR